MSRKANSLNAKAKSQVVDAAVNECPAVLLNTWLECDTFHNCQGIWSIAESRNEIGDRRVRVRKHHGKKHVLISLASNVRVHDNWIKADDDFSLAVNAPKKQAFQELYGAASSSINSI